MRMSNPALVIAGLIALLAGYGTASWLRDDAVADSQASNLDGATEITPEGSSDRERIHPELRKFLIGEARAVPDGLEASDFPDVVERALAANEDDKVYALVQRWAEVDLDSMFQFFLKRGKVALPMSFRESQSYEDLLFTAFVRRDPREAVEAAMRFPSNEGCLNTVLGMIAVQSPDLAIELALENLRFLKRYGLIDMTPETNLALARALAEREPFGTLERDILRQLHSSGTAKESLEFWRSLSPEAQERTMRILIPGVDDGSPESGAIFAILKEKLATTGGNDSKLAADFFNVFAKRMIEENGLGSSIRWVEESFRIATATNGVFRLIEHASRLDVPRETLLAEFDELERSPLKTQMASSVVMMLFRNDPEAALEWAIRLPEEELNTKLMAHLGRQWSTVSEGRVLQAVSDLPVHPATDAFLREVANVRFQRVGGDLAMQWAAKLPEERIPTAVASIANVWASNEIESASNYLAEMEASPVREAFFKAMALRRLQSGGNLEQWIGSLDADDVGTLREWVDTQGHSPEWKAKMRRLLGEN